MYRRDRRTRSAPSRYCEHKKRKSKQATHKAAQNSPRPRRNPKSPEDAPRAARTKTAPDHPLPGTGAHFGAGSEGSGAHQGKDGRDLLGLDGHSAIIPPTRWCVGWTCTLFPRCATTPRSIWNPRPCKKRCILAASTEPNLNYAHLPELCFCSDCTEDDYRTQVYQACCLHKVLPSA